MEINGDGQIIAKDKTVSIPIKNAEGTVENKTYNYGLDPANTSVLNDVRLASRGGARLSDILPNYIAKGIYQISSGTTHPVSYNAPKPNCPENYVAAITVTPLKWSMPKVVSVQVPEVSIDPSSLKVSGESVSGTLKTPSYSFPVENITQSRHNFAIEINPDKSGDRIVGTADDKWTIKLGYKTNVTDTDFQTLSDLKSGEIQALAQTYCVYKPSDTTYDPNVLTDETKVPDNLKQ